MVTVLAAQHWRSNAEMMAEVAELWIDLENDLVLDPTYGKGGFWKKVRPVHLIGTDLDPEKTYVNWRTAWDAAATDFRQLTEHFDLDAFDVVTFDPTYVVPGGKTTTTIPKFFRDYGMDTCARTGDIQWNEVIVPGALECHRVLKPGGLLMWKGQNYISSTKYHNYRQDMTGVIRALGMEQVDEFIYVRKAGSIQDKNRTKKCPRCKRRGIEILPNPTHEYGSEWRECSGCEGTGRAPVEQQHSRNNYSFLIIARKARI